MPQLHPSPWFFIMLTSWLTFSLIIQPKLLSFVSMNPPSNKPPIVPSTTPEPDHEPKLLDQFS